MPWRTMARRSTPIPKANPENCRRVIAHRLEHIGVDHPAAQHLEIAGAAAHSAPRLPPSQAKQETSSSALGSVNGKKWGRSRTVVLARRTPRAKWERVPLRSENVIELSTARPSI